jgi:hypothetical protein
LQVITVTARDEDSENNSRVAYQLRSLDVTDNQDISGLFDIGLLTGRITAKVPLDRERTSMYVLTVIATDSGE